MSKSDSQKDPTQQLLELLSNEVYIFPNDENSNRQFHDDIDNENIEVIGKQLKPGDRRIVAKRDISNGDKPMAFEYKSVLFFNEYEVNGKNIDFRVPHSIKKYESVLKPFIDKSMVSLPEEDKLTLRFLFRFYLCYLEDSKFKERVNNLCTMQSHQRANGEHARELTSMKNIMVNIIKEFYGRNYNQSTQIPLNKRQWRFIENLIAITIINCNKLHDHTNMEIGLGLDPTFSLINHSCLSNSVLTYKDSSTYELTCTLPIRKGEEITVSYVETCLPRELRRSQIFTTYYFHCNCRLCQLVYDPFFSHYCQKCRSRLKSSSLKSVLWLFESQDELMEPICPCCNAKLDLQVYKKNFNTRLFFLAFILLGKTDLALDNETYMKYLLNELHTLVKKKPWNYIIKLLDDLYTEVLVPQSRLPFFSSLLEDVILEQVFPLFTFPFNIVYCVLENSASVDIGEEGDFQKAVEHLRIEARKLFLINIPSDLCLQLRITGSVYQDLVKQIAEVVKMYNELTMVSSTSLHQTVEFIHVLCSCGFFFGKQLSIPQERECLEDMMILFQSTASRCESNDAKGKRNEYCLNTFFKFANIRVEWMPNGIGIYNAIGELVTLFYTFDLDDIL